MNEREKQKLRQIKRDVKRAGNKHRRQMLKRSLRDDPEEAHRVVPSVGRYRSTEFNGFDRDSTRIGQTVEE